MPLRKSPLLTPALFSASPSANGFNSNGTLRLPGRARASLNALKHGRYAVHLRRKLLEAGDRQGEALYARIEAPVADAFCCGRPRSGRVGEEPADDYSVVPSRSPPLLGALPGGDQGRFSDIDWALIPFGFEKLP
jgi:hypothetical protein